MPFFSVVIPLYNKQQYIRNTIKSVLKQDDKDFEIILIDDGSTDNSLKQIEDISDPRLKIFRSQNQGVSSARNLGIQKSQGKILAFLDADDFWYPQHLSEIRSLYENFPEAKLYATGYEIEYPEGFTKTFGLHQAKTRRLFFPFYKYTSGAPLFYTSNFALLKEIFDKQEAFKTHIHAEDTELFLRLGYLYPLAYSSLITMRHTDSSHNSLFSSYKTEMKEKITDELHLFEDKDLHLKRILDINRFSWVIEYKLQGKKEKATKLNKEIYYKSLSVSQNILRYLPGLLLNVLKKTQKKFKKKHWYVSPY